MSSPSPKGVSGGFVDSLKPYPYDPDRAKSLLREAGYPNGFTVNFKAPNGRYLQDKQVAEDEEGEEGTALKKKRALAEQGPEGGW